MYKFILTGVLCFVAISSMAQEVKPKQIQPIKKETNGTSLFVQKKKSVKEQNKTVPAKAIKQLPPSKTMEKKVLEKEK